MTLKIGNITYKVEKVYAPPSIHPLMIIPYKLYGPRGAIYSLIRNKHDAHLMFASNGHDFTKGTPFESKWFSDKDGTLKFLG